MHGTWQRSGQQNGCLVAACLPSLQAPRRHTRLRRVWPRMCSRPPPAAGGRGSTAGQGRGAGAAASASSGRHVGRAASSGWRAVRRGPGQQQPGPRPVPTPGRIGGLNAHPSEQSTRVQCWPEKGLAGGGRLAGGRRRTPILPGRCGAGENTHHWQRRSTHKGSTKEMHQAFRAPLGRRDSCGTAIQLQAGCKQVGHFSRMPATEGLAQSDLPRTLCQIMLTSKVRVAASARALAACLQCRRRWALAAEGGGAGGASPCLLGTTAAIAIEFSNAM